MSHTGVALALSARLENSLEQILQSAMPNLSNAQKPRLFEGYGPLASFSSKIEITFALGHIKEEEKRYLHAIREIRNKFAHSPDHQLNFDSPEIIELCEKLPNKRDKTKRRLTHFLAAHLECSNSLQHKLNVGVLVDALRGRSEQQKKPAG